MSIITELRRWGWGVKYAFSRTKTDFFQRTTAFSRFSLFMTLIAVIASAIIYSIIGKAEIAFATIFLFIIGTVILRSPDWSILPILIIICTIFGTGSLPDMIARYLVGGTNVFQTSDLLLYTSIILGFWEYLALPKDKRPVIPRLAWAIGAFSLVVILNVLISLSILKVSWATVYGDLRGLQYFALFFPIILMVHTKERIKTFFIGLAVCLIVTALYNISVYMKPDIANKFIFILGSIDVVSTANANVMGRGSAVRIPNILFILFGAITTFSLALNLNKPKFQWWAWGVFFITLLAIAVNKGRNLYLGSIAGCGLIWLFSAWNVKTRSVLQFLTLMLLFIPLSLAIPKTRDSLISFSTDTYDRFMQTFNRSEYERGGVKERIVEVELAFPHFKKNPIFGYGYGREYGMQIFIHPITGQKGVRPVIFLHNSWMWHALKGGILQIGTLILMVLVWMLHTIIRLRKAETGFEKGICWGTLGFGLAVVMGSAVQGNFYHHFYTITVGLGMALPELAHRYAVLSKPQQENPQAITTG